MSYTFKEIGRETSLNVIFKNKYISSQEYRTNVTVDFLHNKVEQVLLTYFH